MNFSRLPILFFLCSCLFSCATNPVANWNEGQVNFVQHSYAGNFGAEVAGGAFDLFPNNTVTMICAEGLGIYLKDQNRTINVTLKNWWDLKEWAHLIKTALARENIKGKIIVNRKMFEIFLRGNKPHPTIEQASHDKYDEWLLVKLP